MTKTKAEEIYGGIAGAGVAAQAANPLADIKVAMEAPETEAPTPVEAPPVPPLETGIAHLRAKHDTALRIWKSKGPAEEGVSTFHGVLLDHHTAPKSRILQQFANGKFVIWAPEPVEKASTE